MIFCGFSSHAPQENLAFDEAILVAAFELQAQGQASRDVDDRKQPPIKIPGCLRIWEMQQTCVVMGRGSKIDEVNIEQCCQDNVPVLRRCSGGATIVAGPGCLMFSLVLSLDDHPVLRSIDIAHQWVMTRIAEAVRTASGSEIDIQGSCDLTWQNKKFSGNAVRYNRDWILYHGTLLYQFPLKKISTYLRSPARQPEYRKLRSHDDFLTNISATRESLVQGITDQWQAYQEWESSPLDITARRIANELLQTKYK